MGWGEIGVVMVVTLALLGPKDAAPFLRTLGRLLHRFNKFKASLLADVQDAAELADLDHTLRQEAETGAGKKRVERLVQELLPPQEKEK